MRAGLTARYSDPEVRLRLAYEVVLDVLSVCNDRETGSPTGVKATPIRYVIFSKGYNLP
jgi:hypothetical protein